MKAIKQCVVKRDSRRVDEGTCGFSDWVTKYEEFGAFVLRVSVAADELITNENAKIKNISYPSENIAVIVYSVRE